MFSERKKIDPDARNTPSDRSSTPPSAVENGIPRSERLHAELSRAELHAHWKEAGHQILRAAFGPAPRVPEDLRPLAQALIAHDFSVLSARTGFQSADGIPFIEIGAAPKPFTIRFREQEPFLSKQLAAISIPLMLRLEHPIMVGLRALSPETCGAVMTAENQSRYPAFAGAVAAAFRDSETVALKGPKTTPTDEEEFRTSLNLIIAHHVGLYVDDFRASPRASVDCPVILERPAGEPCRLIAGNRIETDPLLQELHLNPLRGQIIRERHGALNLFAEFLRDSFFR